MTARVWSSRPALRPRSGVVGNPVGRGRHDERPGLRLPEAQPGLRRSDELRDLPRELGERLLGPRHEGGGLREPVDAVHRGHSPAHAAVEVLDRAEQPADFILAVEARDARGRASERERIRDPREPLNGFDGTPRDGDEHGRERPDQGEIEDPELDAAPPAGREDRLELLADPLFERRGRGDLWRRSSGAREAGGSRRDTDGPRPRARRCRPPCPGRPRRGFSRPRAKSARVARREGACRRRRRGARRRPAGPDPAAPRGAA